MRKLTILETPEDIVEAFSPVRDGEDKNPFPYVGSDAKLFVSDDNRLDIVNGNESIEIGDVTYDDLCDYVLGRYHIVVEG